jgi:hypothetical protein
MMKKYEKTPGGQKEIILPGIIPINGMYGDLLKMMLKIHRHQFHLSLRPRLEAGTSQRFTIVEI